MCLGGPGCLVELLSTEAVPLSPRGGFGSLRKELMKSHPLSFLSSGYKGALYKGILLVIAVQCVQAVAAACMQARAVPTCSVARCCPGQPAPHAAVSQVMGAFTQNGSLNRRINTITEASGALLMALTERCTYTSKRAAAALAGACSQPRGVAGWGQALCQPPVHSFPYPKWLGRGKPGNLAEGKARGRAHIPWAGSCLSDLGKGPQQPE